MLRTVTRYSLLTLASFFFFSTAFHTVAHAQTFVQENNPEPTQVTVNTEVLQQISTPETMQQEQAQTITPTKQPSPAQISKIATALITPTKTKPTPTPITSEQTKIPATPTPTAITSTPAETITPTITAAPATPTPTITSTHIPQQSNSGGMDAQKLFAMVNSHRQSIGLSALQQDERSCSLAASRAPEIAGELASGTLHSGMYARNLPYWNTENAIALGPEEAALSWWINEPIHRQAIESPTHTHSCVACTGNYCVQEFTSYQSK